MDIKEILWEFTRRGPSYMPYHDDEGLLYIIWYLDNYHPYRQQGIKNWRFDQASSVMLRFKQGQPEAIGCYLLKILGKFGRHAKYREVIEDSNLRFAVVPGHEAGKDESSVHKLARMLSAYYGRADYSCCLRRKYNMAKLSTGGNRSLLKQYQSMEVDASYTVSGKKYLLMDDIRAEMNKDDDKCY